MFVVPLILGLSAIYVLIYGTMMHTEDLPPIDRLAGMEPHQEPRRPAPVATQDASEPVARQFPTPPTVPVPVDHWEDDLKKKMQGIYGKDTQILMDKKNGKLREIKLGNKSQWIKNPHVDIPDDCTINGKKASCEDMDDMLQGVPGAGQAYFQKWFAKDHVPSAVM